MLHIFNFFGHFADCDEDLESVHEGIHDLAGSSATKRKRARKILKTPEKKVLEQYFLTTPDVLMDYFA